MNDQSIKSAPPGSWEFDQLDKILMFQALSPSDKIRSVEHLNETAIHLSGLFRTRKPPSPQDSRADNSSRS
jgi:hypothetical protein